jgi:hypothetical protein
VLERELDACRLWYDRGSLVIDTQGIDSSKGYPPALDNFDEVLKMA